MTTRDIILSEIKKYGVRTSQDIAGKLGMTTMGARQHLINLEEEGIVSCCSNRPVGRGRPAKGWELTKKANAFFPDTHHNLSVDLLASVKQLYGSEGLEKLIDHRSKAQAEAYAAAISKEDGIENRLETLKELRTQEGYMADHMVEDESYLFVENHCPICDAAASCETLCVKELDVFKEIFRDIADVERTEHKLRGARRCAYKVTPKKDVA